MDIKKTPSKIKIFVKPGDIAINSKWKNTSLLGSFRGLFNEVKFHSMEVDFILSDHTVVFWAEDDLKKFADNPPLPTASLVVGERNTTTIAIYNSVQMSLFLQGVTILPVGNVQEVPLLLHQLSLGDQLHSPGSTFRGITKAPDDIQVQLLLLVPGLGRQKAAKLLKVFESVQKIAFASVEDLIPVVGVSSANSIHKYFHDPLNR